MEARTSYNRRVRGKRARGRGYCDPFSSCCEFQFPDFPKNFCDEFAKGTLSTTALWRATFEKKDDTEGWLVPPVRVRPKDLGSSPDEDSTAAATESEPPAKRHKTEEAPEKGADNEDTQPATTTTTATSEAEGQEQARTTPAIVAGGCNGCRCASPVLAPLMCEE